jgi:hypothetical protein
VFARGADDQLWGIVKSGNAWQSFEPFGGQLTAAPSTTLKITTPIPVITFAVTGTDHHIWTNQAT